MSDPCQPARSAVRRCCAYLRAKAAVTDHGGTVTLQADGMGVFLATRETYEAARAAVGGKT
jgi:hypothetical protein